MAEKLPLLRLQFEGISKLAVISECYRFKKGGMEIAPTVSGG
jgi:hypothetical protein